MDTQTGGNFGNAEIFDMTLDTRIDDVHEDIQANIENYMENVEKQKNL